MSTLLFFLTILPSLTPLAQAGLSTGAIIEAALVPNKQIEITFDDASELKIGTAVNVDGVKVGEVVEISSSGEEQKSPAAKAVIKMNQQSALSLSNVNIALISTQLSNISKNSTVIELLSLKSLSSQNNIVGFSSHEKFWNSPLI